MIIDNEVEVIGHPRNVNYYREKGYSLNVGDHIKINPFDLTKGSSFKVNCKCCSCLNIKRVSFKDYYLHSENFTKKYYCKNCMSFRMKETCMEIHGVDNYMKVEEVKNILSESIRNKYGVDHYSMTNEYKDSYKNTCIEKFGVDNPFKSEEIKKLIKTNNLEKTGFEYPSQNPEVMEKITNTFLSKYNCKRPLQNNDILNKMYANNLKKWNVRNTFELDSARNYKKSLGEQYIIDFIKSYNIDYIENCRKTIYPKEIDIVLPYFNIAFEYNGSYWHSLKNKEPLYHYNKMIESKSKNINLYHIWDYQIINSDDIVKSIIKCKLDLITEKLHARKCKITANENIIDYKEFFNNNHIDGYIESDLYIGLKLDNKLVFSISFIKKDGWYINRFCSKINTIVNGGFSKILHFFKMNYLNNDFLYVFSDTSLFDGNIFNKFKFKEIDLIDDVYYVTNNYKSYDIKNNNSITIQSSGIKKYQLS